jgi:hypothetical protein
MFIFIATAFKEDYSITSAYHYVPNNWEQGNNNNMHITLKGNNANK